MELDKHYDYAQRADAEDDLRIFREQFLIPERKRERQTYFLGNSLGLQPVTTADRIQEILKGWASFGVEGFFEGRLPWLSYHDQLLPALATIVGAKPAEITVMNQLTVNLHLLLVSFYQPRGKRIKIITEAKAFPSDQYMLETHIRQRGLEPEAVWIEVKPRTGEDLIRHEDILACIDEHADETALVFWGGVNYYTGQVFDMKGISAAAKAAGAKIGLDLAHAAGNVPLDLHNWDVDFAAWCHYKYLNAGPGAVAGAYIHERYHSDTSLLRLAGWWGYQKETRFLMEKGFRPIETAEGWQLSTPSPILYASLLASLEIFSNAGWENILLKQQSLRGFGRQLLKDLVEEKEGRIRLLTPEGDSESGCQFSLLIPEKGKAIFKALSERGFMTDWREPDCIRLAPVPLYNQHMELWSFVQVLRELL